MLKRLRAFFTPPPNTTEQAVLGEIGRNRYDVWTVQELADVLSVPPRHLPKLLASLESLVAEGELYRRNHSRVTYYRGLPFA